MTATLPSLGTAPPPPPSPPTTLAAAAGNVEIVAVDTVEPKPSLRKPAEMLNNDDRDEEAIVIDDSDQEELETLSAVAGITEETNQENHSEVYIPIS